MESWCSRSKPQYLQGRISGHEDLWGFSESVAVDYIFFWAAGHAWWQSQQKMRTVSVELMSSIFWVNNLCGSRRWLADSDREVFREQYKDQILEWKSHEVNSWSSRLCFMDWGFQSISKETDLKTIDVKVRVQTSNLLRSLSHQFRNYLKTEKEKSQVRARRGVSRRRVKPQFSETPSFFFIEWRTQRLPSRREESSRWQFWVRNTWIRRARHSKFALAVENLRSDLVSAIDFWVLSLKFSGM